MSSCLRLFLPLNLRGQKSLGPLKMFLEMVHKLIVPQKKIMSRSFLNSGTLIVNTEQRYDKNFYLTLELFFFPLCLLLISTEMKNLAGQRRKFKHVIFH